MASAIPRSSSNEAPRRATRGSHFWRAPHRQVGALLLLGVFLSCIVVAVTVVRMDESRAPIERSSTRLVPPEADLTESKVLLSTLNRKYLSTFSLPAEERSLVVASLAADYSAFTSAFSNYKKHSAALPGEMALQEQFHVLLKASDDLSISLLGYESITAANVDQYALLQGDLQDVLQRIQSLYSTRIGIATTEGASGLSSARQQLVPIVALALLVLLVVAALVIRTLRRSWLKWEAQRRHDELETRLHRALELTDDEDKVFELVHEALLLHEPKLSAELLIADSSRAHLHQVLATNLEGLTGGCPVGSPADCPAATRSRTQIYPSSRDLDACPHLKHRPGGPLAAVCVPVSVAGSAIGVIHAMTPEDQPIDANAIETLELVARRAGDRVGMVRAFARSETQARTDPLTGLLNRRSLEVEAQEITASGLDYTVAYGDLDHFKQLNDIHGHDAGDRALRLFARVLRDSVRPSDIPARYGGEEFVVVLPQCTVADAAAVLERVRQQLAFVVSSGSGPEFTVSFGIAGSGFHDTFSETIDAADAAMFAAKAAGRDRIELADPSPLDAFVAEVLADESIAVDLPKLQKL